MAKPTSYFCSLATRGRSGGIIASPVEGLPVREGAKPQREGAKKVNWLAGADCSDP